MVEETRAKLIQAARKAFATEGYAAASMDDLTAEAGLTRGALYHNFGDKKGLLQAVIDQIDAEMLTRMRAAQDRAETRWLGFLDEGVAYIEMASGAGDPAHHAAGWAGRARRSVAMAKPECVPSHDDADDPGAHR